MSSNTFHIKVIKMEGNAIEIEAITSTAGGANDFATTRSFALMVLGDCPNAALANVLNGQPVWDTDWMKQHVDTYVSNTEFLGREGFIHDEPSWAEGRSTLETELWVAGTRGVALNEALDQRFPKHKFFLRVHVTDPQWLAGIDVGTSFGTTAFDSWLDDPKRPIVRTDVIPPQSMMLENPKTNIETWEPTSLEPEAMATYRQYVNRSSKEVIDTVCGWWDIPHGQYVGAFMLLAMCAIRGEFFGINLADYLVNMQRKVNKVGEPFTTRLNEILLNPAPTPTDLFGLFSLYSRTELECIGF